MIYFCILSILLYVNMFKTCLKQDCYMFGHVQYIELNIVHTSHKKMLYFWSVLLSLLLFQCKKITRYIIKLLLYCQ